MDESSRKEIEMLVQNYTEKPVAELDAILVKLSGYSDSFTSIASNYTEKPVAELDAILVKLSEYPERLIEDAVAKIETEKDQRIRQDLLF